MALQIYKSGQGRYVRVGTAIAAGLVAIVLSYYVWAVLARNLPDFANKVYIEYAVPAVLFAGLAVAGALYLNTPKVADFLIATESEMKKVSWSSRKELLGSTVVVIVTVLVLADFIFLCDLLASGGLAQGVDLHWAKQGFFGRLMTGTHLGLVVVVVSYVVKHLLESRLANRGVAYGVSAALFLVLGVGMVFYWVAGIHLPGLGLW